MRASQVSQRIRTLSATLARTLALPLNCAWGFYDTGFQKRFKVRRSIQHPAPDLQVRWTSSMASHLL